MPPAIQGSGELQAYLDTANGAADLALRAGFLGVGLVLALIVAPIVYYVFRQKPAGVATALTSVIAGILFIAVFGLINILNTVFPGFFVKQQTIIYGDVRNIAKGFEAQITSDVEDLGHAYVKTVYNAEKQDLKDYLFVFLTKSKPKCLAIAVSPSGTVSDKDTLVFDVEPLTTQDENGSTKLMTTLISSGPEKLLKLERYSNEVKIDAATFPPLKDTQLGCEKKADMAAWHLISRAFAQQNINSLSTQQLKERLSSDDIFERRNTKILLSRQGKQGIEDLEPLILDDSNHRAQVGAVDAVSAMPVEQRRSLSPTAVQKLRQLSHSNDPMVRESAEGALSGVAPLN